jgi:hypothetical protein
MKVDLANPQDILTIEQLEAEVEKVFLLADKGVVRMVVATVIASRMKLDPLWLMLVGPSSGGKSELINGISGLPFVHAISDLTVNTFASGMKRTGKDTSLLLKINNGVMAFKDFTSILGKNREARGEILKQLREIYDGYYVKRTGTGDDITWKGRISSIAGVTEIVYRHLEEFSAMGDRFVMYNIKQPDRINMSKRMLENANDISEKREHVKACFSHYIRHLIKYIEEHPQEETILDEETRHDLLDIADFATRTRSAVLTDFKTGLVDFVPSIEMPTRVTAQLYGYASAFIIMKKATPDTKPPTKGREETDTVLTEFDKLLLYKTAFDSIPRTRRDVLRLLAQHSHGISTAGAATSLDLPSRSIGKYLAQVNALGICRRIKRSGPQGDYWRLNETKYRDIILKLEDLKMVEGMLEGNSEEAVDQGILEENEIMNSQIDETSLDVDRGFDNF